MIVNVLSAIIEHIAQHKVQDSTLLVGGTAAATNPSAVSRITGEWLMTHGVGVLSYGEIIRIIGAAGVIVAILNAIGFFRLCGRVFRWVERKID